MSTFKTIDIEGPHVVRFGPRGLYTFPLRILDIALPGSVPTGDLEPEIRLEGRFVADDVEDLDARIDALLDEATFPAEPGTLVDPFGRAHDQMTLIEVAVGDVAIGLRASVEITLTFRRFQT